MAQRTIVSIHEVDECAATGPWVGQGSLVNPGIVLVHPPLSNRIVAEEGPQRLRVGIYVAERDEGSSGIAEVIDVSGEPHVLWQSTDPGMAIVALELHRDAQSPKCEIPGVHWTNHNNHDFHKIAKYLQDQSNNDPRDDANSELRDDGDGDKVPYKALWCKLFPRTCKH